MFYGLHFSYRHKKAPRLTEALKYKFEMAVREGLFIAALFTPVSYKKRGNRRKLRYGLASLGSNPRGISTLPLFFHA